MATGQDRLIGIDRDLVAAAKGIKVLTHLGWPKKVGERFLADVAGGRTRLPDVSYAPVDLGEERRALAAVMARCDVSHPVEQFLYRTARSYARVAEMIEARGTPRFRELSIMLYGSAKDPVASNLTTTREAARRLMASTSELAQRCLTRESDYCVTPEAVASTIRREAELFRHHEVEVVVDARLSPKAAAGAGRIRIRGSTCFTEDEVAQLVHHELLVHTLTALNGRMQPVLTAFGLGAPRTTRTQEGLALFAELVTNSIDINRLRRIASRCIAIESALEGADFVEVFRYFQESGQTAAEAYASAQRVFRGGDVRGGIAFTKDAVYLQGFVRVHEFLRTAIAEGRLQAPHLLLAGRLTTADVGRLAPFFEEGLLAGPVYEPPWLVRRSVLAAFLTHSSFLHELHLGAEEPGLPEESEEGSPA